MAHIIAIIGSGPRGTYGFRRLALKLSRSPLNEPVEIHVIDRSGNYGGGFVHNPAQPDYLLLNTVASQITALGDDDHEARRSFKRKTLHGYLVSEGLDIGLNDYPARAHHGQYLAHVFEWTEENLPPGVTVHRHAATAVDIDPVNGQTILLGDGTSVNAGEILLVTGHAVNGIRPDSEPEQWGRFAAAQQKKGKNVTYIHHVYPIEEMTRHIRPNESVYVIGMGLTAIDIVRAFTWGRGGCFKNGAYTASGNEPYAILGSRIGLPYSARAHNQKTRQYQPAIFTADAVRRLKAEKTRLDFQQDIFPLIFQEMEFVYYTTLLGDAFGRTYLTCAPEIRAEMIRSEIPYEKRLSWEDLQNPLRALEARTPSKTPVFASLSDYMAFITKTMADDIREADLGNMTSPLKNAVDSVLRDCRDILRMAVNFGGLTPASHKFLNRSFDRVNNRIAVGPPVESCRQLLHLAEIGKVGFSGPDPEIGMDRNRGEFLIRSPQVRNSERYVQHILNGRIHGVNLREDSSALMQNLLRRGLVRPYVNRDGAETYRLGGLDVSEDFHIIAQNGAAHPHICALGIPAEGKIWFNAADARPDVNSTAITQLSDWAEAAVERLRLKEQPR
ncbi:MAG: FAD/NAD(P)-binding protein [Deltaproteobacteria bacterium]